MHRIIMAYGVDPSRYREDGTHPAFPPGFRFLPREDVLVKEFLAKRVSEEPMTDNPIKEMDVYLHDPPDLPVTISDGNHRWMYFIVEMAEANISRATPNGYWKLVESDEPVRDVDSKKIIAFKNSFIYYTNEVGANGRYKTNWTMEEFRLKDAEDTEDPKMKNLVMCKIKTTIPPVYAPKKASRKRGKRHKEVASSMHAINASGEDASPIHFGEMVDPASVQSYDSKEKENWDKVEIREDLKAKADVTQKGRSKKNIAAEGKGNAKALKLLR